MPDSLITGIRKLVLRLTTYDLETASIDHWVNENAVQNKRLRETFADTLTRFHEDAIKINQELENTWCAKVEDVLRLRRPTKIMIDIRETRGIDGARLHQKVVETLAKECRDWGRSYGQRLYCVIVVCLVHPSHEHRPAARGLEYHLGGFLWLAWRADNRGIPKLISTQKSQI